MNYMEKKFKYYEIDFEYKEIPKYGILLCLTKDSALILLKAKSSYERN